MAKMFVSSILGPKTINCMLRSSILLLNRCTLDLFWTIFEHIMRNSIHSAISIRRLSFSTSFVRLNTYEVYSVVVNAMINVCKL